MANNSLFAGLSNITTKEYDDTLKVLVESKKTSECILDFKESPKSNIELTIQENSFLNLIIQGIKCQNTLTINLKNNADLHLNIAFIQDEASGNYIFNLENNSKVLVGVADLSKSKGVISATFNLYGDNAKAEWHLASLGAEDDDKQFDINFNHFGKATYGIMSNYGVVENKSKLHFKGISHIKKGSDGSTTHQSAKIMVFDENCNAKANPILKIDENNIQASHAAIVGKISDEHMFYLCSRGISEIEAKRLITLGYLKPITNYFDNQKIVEQISNSIEKRL